MRKLLLLLVFITSTIIAQETCESPKESIEDLNSITKCSIKSSKKTKDKKSRQISVRVSASKNRFLKKRIKKKMASTTAGNLSTSGVSNTSHSSDISNSLAIKKEKALNNVANLTNTLSLDEVRRANRFSTVDKIPMFAACENGKKSQALDCFNEEMIKHIQEHFRYPHEAVVNKTQGEVWVRFIIDQDGNVTNIKTLGPKDGKILDQEAIRVVSKLPRFVPGVKDGKRTAVKYGFTITFSLEE